MAAAIGSRGGAGHGAYHWERRDRSDSRHRSLRRLYLTKERLMNGLTGYERGPSARWPIVLAIAFFGTACNGPRFGLASATPEVGGWPVALIGSWSLIDSARDSARTSDEDRITFAWRIEPGGRLRYLEVRRQSSGTATMKEREVGVAWWWADNRRVGGAPAQVVCVSSRPGRGRDCAQVTIDTIPGPANQPTRRLTWRGLTFKSQRWTFLEPAM